ncbi:MAG: hypothetical protein ABL309_13875 [Phycisphaerales bacterium]
MIVGDQEATISRQTRIELGLTISIVVAICALLFVGWRFDKRLTKIEDAIETGLADRWTLSDQREWAKDFKLANPGTPVPLPGSPGRFIEMGPWP